MSGSQCLSMGQSLYATRAQGKQCERERERGREGEGATNRQTDRPMSFALSLLPALVLLPHCFLARPDAYNVYY